MAARAVLGQDLVASDCVGFVVLVVIIILSIALKLFSLLMVKFHIVLLQLRLEGLTELVRYLHFIRWPWLMVEHRRRRELAVELSIYDGRIHQIAFFLKLSWLRSTETAS